MTGSTKPEPGHQDGPGSPARRVRTQVLVCRLAPTHAPSANFLRVELSEEAPTSNFSRVTSSCQPLADAERRGRGAGTKPEP